MNYTAQPFHNAEAFKLFNDAVDGGGGLFVQNRGAAV